MPDLPRFLAGIPNEYKPLAAIIIGAIMMVFLVLVHGAGIHAILVLHKRRTMHLRLVRPRVIRAILLFGSVVFLLLSLHVVGFATWAYSLLFMGMVPRAYNALYFAANAYTTLGFGNVDLGSEWRNIAPIIGISGLFTFAWTTSALATVVTAHAELLEQLEVERAKEIHMRLDLAKNALDILGSERSAEQAERAKTRALTAGASFFQRLRIWRDERKRLMYLRHATVVKLAELRRKECGEEEKLRAQLTNEKPGDTQ